MSLDLPTTEVTDGRCLQLTIPYMLCHMATHIHTHTDVNTLSPHPTPQPSCLGSAPPIFIPIQVERCRFLMAFIRRKKYESPRLSVLLTTGSWWGISQPRLIYGFYRGSLLEAFVLQNSVRFFLYSAVFFDDVVRAVSEGEVASERKSERRTVKQERHRKHTDRVTQCCVGMFSESWPLTLYTKSWFVSI